MCVENVNDNQQLNDLKKQQETKCKTTPQLKQEQQDKYRKKRNITPRFVYSFRSNNNLYLGGESISSINY